MTCEIYKGISRPIDAFIKYFLDIKPYHTKILEVLERYNFQEDVTVKFDENLIKNIVFENNPLCRPTGWGVDWDDECGFDAIQCCDLFDCIGGYGLIFDNSDLLVSEYVTSLDTNLDTITINNDHTFDKKLQIKSINSATEFSISGDQTYLFNTHKLFLIIPNNTFEIFSNLTNGFQIKGNHVEKFLLRKKFTLYGASSNNGEYNVINVSYDIITDLTNIITSKNINDLSSPGFIEIKSSNKNNGAYQVDSVIFNGVDTVITVKSSVKIFNYVNDTAFGSVQFRTGLIAPRIVTLEDSTANEEFNNSFNNEYKILNSEFDYTTGQTTITFTRNILPLSSDTGFPSEDPTSIIVKLYGYTFQSGFDGDSECTTPKPFNIHANFSEYLKIVITQFDVTPTPTITNTTTPTVTPTNTATPSITPTNTPTISVTPTNTTTPTVTPTNTPTISVTPTNTATPSVTPTNTITPTPTPSATPTVTVTPTVTPTNTATPSVTPTNTITPTTSMSIVPGISEFIIHTDGSTIGIIENTGTSSVEVASFTDNSRIFRALAKTNDDVIIALTDSELLAFGYDGSSILVQIGGAAEISAGSYGLWYDSARDIIFVGTQYTCKAFNYADGVFTELADASDINDGTGSGLIQLSNGDIIVSAQTNLNIYKLIFDDTTNIFTGSALDITNSLLAPGGYRLKNIIEIGPNALIVFEYHLGSDIAPSNNYTNLLFYNGTSLILLAESINSNVLMDTDRDSRVFEYDPSGNDLLIKSTDGSNFTQIGSIEDFDQSGNHFIFSTVTNRLYSFNGTINSGATYLDGGASMTLISNDSTVHSDVIDPVVYAITSSTLGVVTSGIYAKMIEINSYNNISPIDYEGAGPGLVPLLVYDQLCSFNNDPTSFRHDITSANITSAHITALTDTGCSINFQLPCGVRSSANVTPSDPNIFTEYDLTDIDYQLPITPVIGQEDVLYVNVNDLLNNAGVNDDWLSAVIDLNITTNIGDFTAQIVWWSC